MLERGPVRWRSRNLSSRLSPGLQKQIDSEFRGHCKGGADTHHRIDHDVLQALGAGDLVTVARGTVVDEAVLCGALRHGVLRGAALDVFEQEPLQDSPLTTLPDVVLSPHAGADNP